MDLVESTIKLKLGWCREENMLTAFWYTVKRKIWSKHKLTTKNSRVFSNFNQTSTLFHPLSIVAFAYRFYFSTWFSRSEPYLCKMISVDKSCTWNAAFSRIFESSNRTKNKKKKCGIFQFQTTAGSVTNIMMIFF